MQQGELELLIAFYTPLGNLSELSPEPQGVFLPSFPCLPTAAGGPIQKKKGSYQGRLKETFLLY